MYQYISFIHLINRLLFDISLFYFISPRFEGKRALRGCELSAGEDKVSEGDWRGGGAAAVTAPLVHTRRCDAGLLPVHPLANVPEIRGRYGQRVRDPGMIMTLYYIVYTKYNIYIYFLSGMPCHGEWLLVAVVVFSYFADMVDVVYVVVSWLRWWCCCSFHFARSLYVVDAVGVVVSSGSSGCV